MEKIIRYKELERIGAQQFPSEFITKHTFYGKTPRKIKDISIPLKIVKINEDFKNSLPDNVLLLSQEGWFFTKEGFLLKRGDIGNIRYKGTKPQRLKLTFSGDKPEVFVNTEKGNEKIKNITIQSGLLVADFSQIEAREQWGYYSFFVSSITNNLLIKQIQFE